MAETTSSPLRLTPPAYQAYDPSAAEVQLLGRMSPETVGGMYGFLLNARTDRQNSSNAYRGDLAQSNALQAALARQKLAQDELVNRRKTATDLVQHGFAPMQAFLPSLQMPGIADPFTPEQRTSLLGMGDQLVQLRERSKALEATGTGLQRSAEAGVIVNPGQPVSMDPAALQRLQSTTQAPLDLQVEAMRERGKAATAGRDNSNLTARFNPLSGETEITGKDQNPRRLVERVNEVRGLFRGQADAQVRADGGTATSDRLQGAGTASRAPVTGPAALPGGAGQTTPPRTAAPSSGAVPPEIRERARAVIPQGAVIRSWFRDRTTGRWTAITTKGSVAVE